MKSIENEALLFTQIYGALVVSLGELAYGAIIAYPTKALPQLKYETESVQLDEYYGSWFAALFLICGFVFCPMGGSLSGLFGRRKMILIMNPVLIIGLAITGFAQNKAMLFLGRIASSGAIHAYTSSIGVYISETAHPDMRSSLVALPPLFISVGCLVVWILNSILDWRMTAFALILPSLILEILIFKLPESPYWLVEKDKDLEAKSSLKFFRGKNFDITNELNEIRHKHQEKVEKSQEKAPWTKIFSMAFLKPFSCIGVLYCISTLHGFNCLLVYMVTIFEETGSTFDIELGPILVGSVRVAVAILAPFVIKRFNPKHLFIFWFFVSASCMATLGVMAYLHEFHPELTQHVSWIPITSAVISVFARSAGMLPVLHTLINELYPTEIRTLAIGITEAIYLASGAVNVKLFPEMKSGIGLYGNMFFYAFMGYLNVVWGYLTISDNRGKSLVKVEENLKV